MAIVEHNGYLVNDQTGEVMGHADIEQVSGDTVTDKAQFEVNSIETAEWVLEKMQAADAAILAEETRRAAINANIDRIVREQQKRRDWLQIRFGNGLEYFTSTSLKDKKERSIVTPYGTLQMRKNPGKIEVFNIDKALEWAKKNAPDAWRSVTKESIVVKPLKGREHELPEDAFVVTDPYEKFSIDTGVKAPKQATSEEAGNE